jgi:WD40 repeat protein
LPIYAGAFSPDGKSLTSGGGDRDKAGELKLWDVATRQEKPLPHAVGQIYAVAFSHDGKTLASGGATVSGAGEVKLWDTASGTEVATFRGHTGGVRAVAFTRNGKALASGDDEGLVCFWGIKE